MLVFRRRCTSCKQGKGTFRLPGRPEHEVFCRKCAVRLFDESVERVELIAAIERFLAKVRP